MPEKCPICKKFVNYSLIPVSERFDTACCYDCLSPELQHAYDKVFCREIQNEPVKPVRADYEPKIDRETRLDAKGKQDLFE